jgi:hypothetical protein
LIQSEACIAALIEEEILFTCFEVKRLERIAGAPPKKNYSKFINA